MSEIKAVLCDIGGVLYVGDTPIEGAVEAVARIKEHFSVRFLTNTTQTRGEQLAELLQKMGFDIEPYEIITALDVTKMYLQEHRSNAYYLLTDEAKKQFTDLTFENIDYVVVGDAQENFSYGSLNTAFRHLHSGATLLAAAKNRYFKDADGELSMDAGGFVQALEYAVQKEAKIIGKPSMEFYHLACQMLAYKPEECIMIGDDIESDIGGAQDAGLKTVLVKTGKFRPQDLQTGIKADMVIDSIADFTL
ncbi:TIGR01458 family HAD-type hydrolase [Sulfurimonas sp. HSL3-2]|uniref:TIGR01458 family HAD-type hydrolase n=1 Tax=Hydrocurvibacter mobilis TaxID=3131936 RepID=UPI0031F89E1C